MYVLLITRLLRLVGRWARKPVNNTSWVAAATLTDRPKSVCNCCLIEFFVALFVLSLSPFDISVGVGAFVIGLSQISSFLSLYLHLFSAAVWSVATRFPASGCLNCYYPSHSSSDLVVLLIPLYYGIFSPQLPEPQYGYKFTELQKQITSSFTLAS